MQFDITIPRKERGYSKMEIRVYVSKIFVLTSLNRAEDHVCVCALVYLADTMVASALRTGDYFCVLFIFSN